MRRRLVAGGVVIAVLAIGLIAATDHIQFRLLVAFRKDPDVAHWLAQRLAQSPGGVRLAVADLDAVGGRTRGWSCWIADQTPHSTLVQKLLLEVANAPHERFARRAAAIFALWRRTGEEQHLVRLFQAAQPGGTPSVQSVRHWLALLLDAEDDRCRLDVPASQPLNLTVGEFLAMKRRAK